MIGNFWVLKNGIELANYDGVENIFILRLSASGVPATSNLDEIRVWQVIIAWKGLDGKDQQVILEDYDSEEKASFVLREISIALSLTKPDGVNIYEVPTNENLSIFRKEIA